MASLPYVQQLSKVIVAQITQTIGWHSIQTTPLELLSDILHKYLEELTRQTQRYAELYGRTEPNLDDVALAFGDLNIQIPDLEEYIVNVDAVPCMLPVPKFPVPKDSNLNFLKAGSKEVVTRPVYVHEHLPPIHPQEEPQPAIHENGLPNATPVMPETSYAPASNHIKSEDDIHMFDDIDAEHSEEINLIGETTVVENVAHDDDFGNAPATAATFKKPLEPISSSSTSTVGRPTREIVSCMMTTSGFISPAREGKLPDAKRPIIILEEEPPVRPPPPPADVKPTASDLADKKAARIDSGPFASDVKLESVEQTGAGGSSAVDDIKPFKSVASLSSDGDGLSVKKKSKYTDASLKELKKAKKLRESKMAKLTSAKNRKLSKVLNKLLVKPSKRNALLLESGAAIDIERVGGDMSNLTEDQMMALLSAKKKLKMQQKRRYKKELLLKQGGSKHATKDDGTSPQKQRKKREPKLPKIPKRDQVNFASTSSYAYGGDSAAASSHHMRPYSSQEMLNVHPYGNDSSSIGVDKDESMDMIGGEHQHPDKLSTEPDKRKLNIFKKISTPSSSAVQSATQSFEPNWPSSARKPSKSAQSDATPWPSGDPSQPMTPVKMRDMSAHTTPLFSDPTLLTSTPYPADMAAGKKSKLKGTTKVPKPPKIPKEKKLKKDLTQRKPRTPKAPKSTAPAAHLSPKFVPPPHLNPAAPMPMFPNMGFLDQFSGPGLIPTNPLFPAIPFGMPGNNSILPYPVLPSYNDLLHFSRFKRPQFDDAGSAGSVDPNRNPAHSVQSAKDDSSATSADKSVKPLCHVAPFVPPSLLSSVGLRESVGGSPQYLRNDADDGDQAFVKQRQRKSHRDSVEACDSSQGSPDRHMDAAPISRAAPHASPDSRLQHVDATIVIDSDDDDDSAMERTADQHGNDSFQPNRPNRQMPLDAFRLDEHGGDGGDGSVGGGGNNDDDISAHSSSAPQHSSKKTKDKSSTGHNKKDKKDKKKKKSREKEHKDKATLKEEKRRKKKEKDRLAAATAAAETNAISSTGAGFSGAVNPTSHATQSAYTESIARGEPSRDTFDGSEYGHDAAEASAIPKLTLKLAPSSSSPSSRPSTPDFPSSKKSSKAWKKKSKWRPLDDDSDKSQSGADDSNYQTKRDSSPELARISALITRPPKQKSKESPSGKIADHSEHMSASRSDFYSSSSIPTASAVPTGPGRGRPKGSTNSNKNKSKSQKSATMATTVGSVSFNESISSGGMDTSSRQSSALQTLDQEMAEENQVWICPACGRVDDGTPMIGCDGCDAWYHWVCVGIAVAPEEDQDWFCRVCISKKQGVDKKKKRKKKDKKDH